MRTRHILYEFIDGKPMKIGSEFVEFIEITGSQSAIIVDKNGIIRKVRRHTLLDVPQHILHPDIQVHNVEHEDWRNYTHFN